MVTNIVVPIDELTDAWGLRPVAGGNWTAGNYAAGAVANYGGSLYFANKSTSQVPGAGADWTLLIAAAFAPVVAFASGIAAKATAPVTLVTEGGTLYACIADHTTTGTRDPSKWLAIVSPSAGSLVEVSGGWNASTNSPALSSGVGANGALYRVTTAGNTVLDGVGSWNAGDYAFYSIDRWVKLRGHVIKAADISDASSVGLGLLTAADVAAQRIALRVDGVMDVNDVNATIPDANLSAVSYTALTAPRELILPVITSFGVGQAIVVQDVSGQCSPARAISVLRGGSSTINGQTSFVIAEPFGAVLLRRVSATQWAASPISARVGQKDNATGAYTFVRSDHGVVIRRTASVAMGDTLPVFDRGWSAFVQNDGAGLLTITPASGTIAGRASLVVPPGSGVRLLCDGTNYVTIGDTPQANGRWLLATASITSLATYENATAFLSGFSEYEIALDEFISATNNDHLGMRFRNGGSYVSTGYRNAGSAVSELGATIVGSLTNRVQFSRASVATNSGMGLSGIVSVFDPRGAAFKRARVLTSQVSTGVFETNISTGVWENTGAVDGFSLFFNTGPIASGSLRIYGLR